MEDPGTSSHPSMAQGSCPVTVRFGESSGQALKDMPKHIRDKRDTWVLAFRFWGPAPGEYDGVILYGVIL